MPTEPAMREALAESRAMREQGAGDKAKALARAVSDVMDGSITMGEAVKRGVSEKLLKAELDARGYVSPFQRRGNRKGGAR